jgi:hypothetical protein
MKNIHLLPTTKEQHSIIRKHTGLLLIQTTDKVYSGTKLNLYITSDEKIKEGDWCIVGNGVSKLNTQFTSKEEINANWKKIILTTDQDLIADGVQAIDDEFLEWFVKNPSCESVEVEKRYSDFTVDPFVGYKIIIPQEDPKQDPTLENAKLALREHILANKEKVAEDLQEMRKKSGNGRYETLEEASEMFTSKYYSGEGYERDIEEAVKFGAKWQAERMYSYDELRAIAYKYYCMGQLDSPTEGMFNLLIQQDKKK